MAEFSLHPRLAADTLALGELPLCRVLLMNDSRFPWLILVPRRADITELHQLTVADQHQLLAESSLAARALLELGSGSKINLGALGNLVPQLHWHLIARSPDDPCWPGPVWGNGQPRPRDESQLQSLAREISRQLPLTGLPAQ